MGIGSAVTRWIELLKKGEHRIMRGIEDHREGLEGTGTHVIGCTGRVYSPLIYVHPRAIWLWRQIMQTDKPYVQ